MTTGDDSGAVPETDLKTADKYTVHAVSVARGVAWLEDAFTLFKKKPLTWISITIIVLVVHIVSSLTLIGELAVFLFWFFFGAGIMVCCATSDEGDDLSIEHLFAGFTEKPGAVLGLSVLYLVIMCLVAVAIAVVI